jgi:NDP-sugar pyrophosphorylase family protein
MGYKVLITTSGIGQRLGELTKYTNKSLVRIGKKPAISYVIESYPKDIPLVITLGYFGDQVKDFVELAYPERKIEFVEVDKYTGEGSSLGYSMLCAKDKLQCPFIYHACDTIVKEAIPVPDENWIIGFKGEESSQYATLNVSNGLITSINDKGAMDYDFIHIGLVGIRDYAKYWDILEKLIKNDPNDATLNDCQVITEMLKTNDVFRFMEFSSWFDIGNMSSLYNARKKVEDHFANLDKVDESIFIFDEFVIKFFYNSDLIEKRVKRAQMLDGLVPRIEGHRKNFYRYEYVKGNLYSRVITSADFSQFLLWAKDNLWKKNKKYTDEEFKKICHKFYFEKTHERIKKFLDLDLVKKHREVVVNGERLPSVEEMLEKVDFDRLTDCEQYNFHGDFILDNIIKTKDSYCLVDWRQDFGGQIECGDIYYDLAKLNHNLTVNHDIINSNMFSVEVENDMVKCDIMRKNSLVECQEVLHAFIKDNGFDLDRVKILTAIIWLNMSPLHHYPFNLFLFYFGKLNLWKALKQ